VQSAGQRQGPRRVWCPERLGRDRAERRATRRWSVARVGVWCRARLLAPGVGTVVVVVVVDERDKGKATVKGQT
jgi:hypothetical protein